MSFKNLDQFKRSSIQFTIMIQNEENKYNSISNRTYLNLLTTHMFLLDRDGKINKKLINIIALILY